MYRRYNHLLGGGREGIIVSHVWSVVFIYAGSLELVLHDGMEVTYIAIGRVAILPIMLFGIVAIMPYALYYGNLTVLN